DRLPILFEGDAAMPLVGCFLGVLLEHGIERRQVDRQKESGAFSHGDQSRRVCGNRRTEHAEPFPGGSSSMTIAGSFIPHPLRVYHERRRMETTHRRLALVSRRGELPASSQFRVYAAGSARAQALWRLGGAAGFRG